MAMSGKLTKAQKQQLQTWIGRGPRTFKLLYSFTGDGSTATAFHQNCNNQGPTVTVVYNTHDTVYGGYTAQSWQSSGSYIHDTDAFLFRLHVNGKDQSDKFTIPTNFEHAIYDNAQCGPTFGAGHVNGKDQSDKFTIPTHFVHAIYDNAQCGPTFGAGHVNGKDQSDKFTIPTHFVHAIYDNAQCGPTFGAGHDLQTFTGDLTASIGVYTLNGYFRFGSTYNIGTLNSADITNDIKTVTDLEVYRVMEIVPVESWRDIPGWNEEYLDSLKASVENFMPPEEVKLHYANILLLGPVGAGKSSFFNTVSSVFRGRLTRQAVCGSAEKSITSKYRMYKIRSSSSQSPLKFRLCDTRGLEETENIDSQDLGYILDGNIPDGYQFNPTSPVTPDSPGFKRAPTLNDRIHCVCFVIDGTTAGVLPEKVVENIKTIQKRIHQKEIPQMLLVTKVDRVCELTDSDTSAVFRSSAVQELVESCSQIFGLPRNHILPHKNYEKEIELSTGVSILALTALKQMLSAAEDYMYNFLED